MKILITGVAGLLGSKFADWLIDNQKKCDIIGIDDLSGGYIENINPKVKFYNINILGGSLKECFEENKPDIVYHFAAYAAEGLSPFIRSYNYQNNLVVTSLIVNECIKHNIKRLVFTSSMAVYGHGMNDVFDEELIPKPIDPYGVAKLACEMDIKIAGEQHGLDWCIIRPHNVYGEKQNIWDKYRNVLGIWMVQYLNKQSMTIYGDGNQIRAFSYIGDCLEPLWNAGILPSANKEIINLGGINKYTINEANKILRKIIGSDDVIYLENRHEVKYATSTYQKSIDILDFKHKTDLFDGLSNMWNWALKQPNRPIKMWDNYELDKGIYEYWKK